MWRVARGTVGRVAALAMAALLTGAPRLIAALDPSAAEHRCECRAGGRAHACDCPVCAAAARAAATAARDARAAGLPPCHQASASAPAERPPEPRPAPSSAPCLRGYCGGADASRPPPGGEPFTVPGAPALRLGFAANDLPAPRASDTTSPPEPELPPPRGA